MRRFLARRERHRWSWAELSRRSGLPVWKLRWWQRRLGRQGPARRSRRAFVPVKVVESRRGCSQLEVITPSGLRILVPGGFSAEDLRRVVEVLGPPC
jgi:hypothetical protein